jgi:hypothetical protein
MKSHSIDQARMVNETPEMCGMVFVKSADNIELPWFIAQRLEGSYQARQPLPRLDSSHGEEPYGTVLQPGDAGCLRYPLGQAHGDDAHRLAPGAQGQQLPPGALARRYEQIRTPRHGAIYRSTYQPADRIPPQVVGKMVGYEHDRLTATAHEPIEEQQQPGERLILDINSPARLRAKPADQAEAEGQMVEPAPTQARTLLKGNDLHVSPQGGELARQRQVGVHAARDRFSVRHDHHEPGLGIACTRLGSGTRA